MWHDSRMNSRRRLALAGAVTALVAPWLAAQDNWPVRPIRIVVPFGAGGVADLTARAVGQKLGEQLGQAIVIDNRPGAGGVTAGNLVAQAEPDGHTLLLDEPLEGLAPIIVEELLRAIRRITREEGLSAIIVEQHPLAILDISDSTVVLDHGTVVHADRADRLRNDPELLDRLLGVAR